jgi:predicted nucleic acid-binding protein
MKKYVIDASVAVKWYSSLDENDLIKADTLLQMHVDGSCELTAPALIVYELANALKFNQNFDGNDVRRGMKDFFALQIGLELPYAYMDSAIELAFKHSLTIYDAVYAALSQFLGIPLITADYKFWGKVRGLPLIEALKELRI